MAAGRSSPFIVLCENGPKRTFFVGPVIPKNSTRSCSGLYVCLGKREVADRIADSLVALRPRPYDRGLTAYAQAQLEAQRGDTTAAIDFLEQALREGAQMNGIFPHNDLMLEPLWANPRFQDLLRPKG